VSLASVTLFNRRQAPALEFLFQNE